MYFHIVKNYNFSDVFFFQGLFITLVFLSDREGLSRQYGLGLL